MALPSPTEKGSTMSGDSFQYVMMNTGETKEVYRDGIDAGVLDPILEVYTERILTIAHDKGAALPLPGGYWFTLTFDPCGYAGFTVSKGYPCPCLSYGYFASRYDECGLAWRCSEHYYLEATDKSASDWPLPEEPESRPFLAVARFVGDVRCDCKECNKHQGKEPDPPVEHLQVPLGEIEKAIGFLLMKEGFPKEEFYEDEAGKDYE
jgi:hypothetical protein